MPPLAGPMTDRNVCPTKDQYQKPKTKSYRPRVKDQELQTKSQRPNPAAQDPGRLPSQRTSYRPAAPAAAS